MEGIEVGAGEKGLEGSVEEESKRIGYHCDCGLIAFVVV